MGRNSVVQALSPADRQRAIELAGHHRAAGRREEAIHIYQQILRSFPHDADTKFLLGTLLAEQGALSQAEGHLADAARLSPYEPHIRNNLGNVYLLAGNERRAREQFQAALRLKPDLAEAAYNLASIAIRNNQRNDAIKHLRQTVAAKPGFAIAHKLLGELLERSNPSSAKNHVVQAARLASADEALQMHAGNALARMGYAEEAIQCFTRACRLSPGNSTARFAIDALSGRNPSAPPPTYAASIFDEMAPKFDKHLDALKYRVPHLLCQAFGALDMPRRHGTLVDLGCGTGLIGAAFRDQATQVIGIDVSERMLEQARSRGVYDCLHCADAAAFLTTSGLKGDLFIAADVFVYVGALEPIFGAVRSTANPGAHFAFSTERTDDGDYFLQTTGRYAHSSRYIASMATQHGFEVCHAQDIVVREENAKAIDGQLFVLRANHISGA